MKEEIASKDALLHQMRSQLVDLHRQKEAVVQMLKAGKDLPMLPDVSSSPFATHAASCWSCDLVLKKDAEKEVDGCMVLKFPCHTHIWSP